MSNELTLNASMEYSDAENTEASLSLVNVLQSVATKKVTRIKQNIAITEVAINLGSVTAPGWVLFVNRDQTNIINLKVATGGAIFGTLAPDVNGDGTGGFAFLKLGSGAQVPYAIALVATCQMDIFVVST